MPRIRIGTGQEATTTSATVDPAATPLQVAMEWITAFEAGDVATFQGLMHLDATANCLNCGYDRQESVYFSQIGESTADVSDSRLLALGNGSLSAVCAAEGRVVTCETLRSSDFGHLTAEGEPTRQWDASYEFTVENGQITRRIITLIQGTPFDSRRIDDYERWLKENLPEAHDEIFAFGTILLSTVDQFAEHQEYVSQYRASL